METQLRLTPQSPRRRRGSSSLRLSETARQTGREGVAKARKELERVRSTMVVAEPERPVVARHNRTPAPTAESARTAA